MCAARTAASALISRCLAVLLLLIFFVLIAVAAAAAQQDDLSGTLKRFRETYAAGNYPAALAEAEKFERGVKARFGATHPNYAVALDALAKVYWALVL
jgi:hypothetical protein